MKSERSNVHPSSGRNEGFRTIGVLTKLDLMDPGTDARDILDNKKIPLRRGYIGVLNRSQKDTQEGRDIQYCIEKEKRFFESIPCYKEMADKMGSPYLQRMLHVELCKHIKECLPAVRQELYQKLLSFRKELRDLENLTGYCSGGTTEIRNYMIKLVHKFSEHLNREVFGLSLPVKMKELTAGALICHKMYTAMQNGLNGMTLRIMIGIVWFLRQRLSRTDCTTKPQIPGQKEMITIIINLHGIRNCRSMPSLALEAVGSLILSHYPDAMNECVESIVDTLNSCVEETAKTMERFPNLRNELLHLMRKSIDDAAFETTEALENHMKAEKHFINTYHPDFEFPKSVEDGTYSENSDAEYTGDLSDESDAIISSTLSKDAHLNKNAELLTEMIKRYLVIQRKQISDTAIKYISYFLLKGVLDFSKEELIATVLGSSRFELLAEDCERDFVRVEEIKKTCNTLNDALNAVQNF